MEQGYENDFWGKISKEEPKQEVERENVSGVENENEKVENKFEIPNSIDGEIVKGPDESIIFLSKYGKLEFTEQEANKIFPETKEGKATLTFIDPKEIPIKIINELLNSNEGDEDN